MRPLAQASEGVCEIRSSLTTTYDLTADRHSKAVENLSARLGVYTKAAYEEIWTSAEQAWIECAEARVKLIQHIAEHSC
jgi:hypothetical protein